MTSILTPVVLTAGASSRMGRPKALLPLGKTTVLGRVLGACAGLGRPIVVTAPDGAAVRAAALAAGATVAINAAPERGQISSLQAGLRLLPAGAAGFLIFPVDFPLVEPPDVLTLVARFAGRGPGESIFVPSYERRRGHPVLVEGTLAPAFLDLTDGQTARDVMRAHQAATVYVQAASDRVLFDMDTPDDYARCVGRLRGLPWLTNN